MTADHVTRLIDAVAHLLGVLLWPAVVVFLALRFGAPIAGFLRNIGELDVKAAGVEATAKSREVAAAALAAADTARAIEDGATIEASDPDDIAEALPDARALRRLQGARVLWVDDRPGNNRFERQALEALGIRIELSESTDDAVDDVSRRSYDLIISDMGRPPDARAGYTLLERLRRDGHRIPFVVYAGSRAPEHVEEAKRRGAVGCTNRPQELIRMVTDSLAARR